MNKIKKELKEFLEYKSNYKFSQKELIKKMSAFTVIMNYFKTKNGNKIKVDFK